MQSSDVLTIGVPLKSIDSMILWLAGTNFNCYRFSVIQKPERAFYNTDDELKFRCVPQKSKLFNHDCNWEGVTFPTPTKNLYVCVCSKTQSEKKILVDNRNTTNVVNDFKPNHPIFLDEDCYIEMSWEVDDSVYRFAPSDQIYELMSVTHEYTLNI